MPKHADPSSEVTRALDAASGQLSQDRVSRAAVLQSLDSARSACAALLLTNFPLASSEKVEDRLWALHLKANTYFRSALHQLGDGGNTKAVERRKLGNDYVKFIKFSQRYFRTYIRSLDQTYGGISALHRLAGRLGPHGDTITDGSETTSKDIEKSIQKDILQSAYRTLVQLGDLSRYREAELADQAPNWSFAVGYYDLARSIVPSSGVAFNQLAIVALGDGNLFQATYYLYRSLSCPHRHPQAESNLRKAFYRIANAWERGELVESASALVAWHLRLLSKISHGKLFKEHEELENEVASRLTDALVKFALESTLRKLFLINFSACAFAQEQFTSLENDEGSMQAYTYSLQLCIRCICVLLSAFRFQLRETATDQPGRPKTLTKEPLLKTLPLLKLSMLWAVKNQRVLVNSVSPAIDKLQLEFWDLLAGCLALCLAICEVESLPESAYLLEEDADTVAFDPLVCEQTRSVWYADNVRLKPFDYESPDQPRDSNVDSLSRLRFFLKTGIEFALGEATPLRYDVKSAEFRCDKGLLHDPETQLDSEAPGIEPQVGDSADSKDHQAPTDSLKEVLDEDNEAERMVSSLVGPDQDDGLHEGVQTATVIGDVSGGLFPTGTHTANDLLAAVKAYSQRAPKAEVSPQTPIGKESSPRQSLPLGLGQETKETIRAVGPGSRPGSGRSGEADLNFIGSSTPQRGGHLQGSPAIGRPASHRLPNDDPTTSHTHPADQIRHMSPAQFGNGSWSPHRLYGNLSHAGIRPAGQGMDQNADLAHGPARAAAPLSDYGMGSSLLFGAGNSPWNVTMPESQGRMPASPSAPVSPSLRRDSGPSASVGGPGSTRRTPHAAGG